ncbi:MAG TPA: hypothetical protein VFB99_07155, partial [Vicinamibacterales bacterium]|nr:hypothetical protein [Vicinamibacterales bacterium]
MAAGVEVTAVGDGSLTIGPAPAIGDPVGLISVGDTGTITGYDAVFQRRFNRIVITNICKSEGQDDRYVDGVWQDTGPLTGVPAINVTTYVASVQRGADWRSDPAGHQQDAHDAAAAAAPRLRGDARQVSLQSAPDFSIRPGQTLDVGFRG